MAAQSTNRHVCTAEPQGKLLTILSKSYEHPLVREDAERRGFGHLYVPSRDLISDEVRAWLHRLERELGWHIYGSADVFRKIDESASEPADA